MRALKSPLPSEPALPRFCIRLRRLAACLALLLAPTLASAQPVPDAADPLAPTAPLAYAGMPTPAPIADAAAAPRSAWRQAHEAVAEFPRGHADILAWEAQAARRAEGLTAAGEAAEGARPPAAMRHTPADAHEDAMRHGGRPPRAAHPHHHHGGKP